MSETEKPYSEQRLEDNFNAYVLFTGPALFDEFYLITALNNECGTVAEWGGVNEAPGQLTEMALITAEEDGETRFVSIMSLPIPVPIEQYEASVRRAYAFPGAQAALEAHQYHYMITLATPSDTDLVSRFKAARLATCVSAMLARLEGCTAILFPSGDIIAEPATWQNAMETSVQGEWPIDSWISFEIARFPPNIEGGMPLTSCGSVGMAAFNGQEVSFVVAPVDSNYAVQQAFGAIFLLLVSGNDFGDGDTIGTEDSDIKLRMRFAREGHLDFQTHTWLLFHPNCSYEEDDLFPPTLSVPPPPGVDGNVQPRPGFFKRLLRRGFGLH